MAQELGQKFDAQRVAATNECRRNEGAIGALAQALDSIDALRPQYRDAAQQSEISPDYGTFAMAVLDDAARCLRNLKLAAEHSMMAQRGKIAQMEAVLDSCQTAFEIEVDAISEVQKALDEPPESKSVAPKAKDPRKRATGEHPGKPIAERKVQAQSE
jgi:hypothetical protein